MKKKFLSTIIIGMILASLVSCGSNSENDETPSNEISLSTEEETLVDAETLQAIADFDEFDLLSIEDGKMYDYESFISVNYVIQNKSAEATISNLEYEYITTDNNGEMIESRDELIQNDNYLIKLEPRKKAEIQLRASVPDTTSHSGWGCYIIKYSYDMNGKRYTVDLVNKLGYVEDIKSLSNVDFNEKNILSFGEAEYLKYQTVVGTNNSDYEIKSLEAKVMVYDADGVITDVEDIGYFTIGQESLKAGDTYSLSVSDLVADENGGHIEIASYSYDLGIADENGYNHFEVNLITEECVGSTNAFLLERDVDIDTSELNTYIDLIGKEIDDIGFEVESIENGTSGGTDSIKLKGVNELFGLSGNFLLLRDYDSLLINGFTITFDAEDEGTKNFILNAMIKSLGDEYEVKKYGYKTGEYLIWNVDNVAIDFSWDYGLSIYAETEVE